MHKIVLDSQHKCRPSPFLVILVLFFLSYPGIGGAGYFINPKILQFRQCTFTNNTGDYGGALYIERGRYGVVIKLHHYELSSCHFADKASTGGAVWTANGNLTLMVKNCTFISNVGTTAAGALWLNSTSVNISHSELSFNKSPYGGAICFTGEFSALHMIKSKLLGNNNVKSFVVHIGIAKTVSMKNVIMHNNSAGGALRLAFERCEIHNCSFKGNTADAAGTILTMGDNSVVLITNSSFFENKGFLGDLVFLNNQVILQNCHFGKPTTMSSRVVFLVTFYPSKRAQLRSYNNVFNGPFFAPIVMSEEAATATIIYIWETFYQLEKNELLPLMDIICPTKQRNGECLENCPLCFHSTLQVS